MPYTAETEQLWRQMHQRLLSFIRQRVRSADDAEDILQDVFVRIHTNLGHLKGAQSVTVPWRSIDAEALSTTSSERAATARIAVATDRGGRFLNVVVSCSRCSVHTGERR